MVLLAIAAVLMVCIVFAFLTRDAMQQLSFLKQTNKPGAHADSQKSIVDTSPWQTAQALAPLARSQEEADLAVQAEQLADHEVDLAFASALRQANARVQSRALTGEALELSKKVEVLQQVVKDDQAQVDRLTPKPQPAGQPTAGGAADDSDDLDIARAQLGLDSDQLADAQKDLARATGDDRGQIQDELAQREAAMKKFDSEPHDKGQRAVQQAGGYSTLSARISAWNSQRSRAGLIEQARQQAASDVTTLTAQHNAMEAQVNTLAASTATAAGDHAATDHASRLANLKLRSAQRQLLSIYDDRIQTEQQLTVVYGKWAAQLALQHRIVLHLILQSLATICILVIFVLVCDAMLVHFMARAAAQRPAADRRRMQTLRTILQLALQVVSVLVVLLVVFGSPRQMPTILGLATAGITVVMQDFIIAFFGWFVLMGKHGIRVGDWVEINGAGGEVTEIGLFRTTVLETGNWTDKGHPTGRRITILNSFAIRGVYFNFSTAGQWMWDEISVSLPPADDAFALVDRIHKAVLEETDGDVKAAEEEWKRGTRQDGLSQFSATPSVNLRPTASGIDLLVRYVTRASERFEVRNRIYQRVVDLLQKPELAEAKPVNPD
jgi:small-conductance mechanosensitive channel